MNRPHGFWIAAALAFGLETTSALSAQAVVGPNRKVNTDSGTSTQVEMIMVADPKDPNRLAVSFKDLRTATTASVNFHAWSSDGGQTWSDRRVQLGPRSGPGFFTGSTDPWMAWWKGGALYDCSLQWYYQGGTRPTGIFVKRSLTGGASFDPPVPAVYSVANQVLDKPAMAVDNNVGSGKYGNLYVAYTTFDTLCPSFRGTQRIWVVHSRNGGATWSPVAARVSDTDCLPNGAVPAVGPNGEVYVVWANEDDSRTIQFDVSTDGGASFGLDRQIAFYRPWVYPEATRANPSFGGRPYYPAMAVDTTNGPHRGTIYVVWTAAAAALGDGEIWLARSTDGGAIWTTRIVNDASGRDQFFADVTVDDAGGVLVSYASRELDPRNREYHIFALRSLDGGQSFTRSVQITDRPSNPAVWSSNPYPQKNEYRNVAANGNRYHAVWTDTRNNNADVYTARFSFDLWPDQQILSAATGGTVNLTVAPGPNHAGRAYALFLSFSGTTPGVNIGGLQVDLNPDRWTLSALQFYNGPNLRDFKGTLDTQGMRTAQLVAPPGFLRSFVGLNLSLVAGVYAPLDYASSSVSIQIVP